MIKLVVKRVEMKFVDTVLGTEFTVIREIYNNGSRRLFNPVNNAKWTDGLLSEMMNELRDDGEFRYERV